MYSAPKGKQTRSSATADIARHAETAIQGHSRSSVFVPIDVAYATSYQHLTVS